MQMAHTSTGPFVDGTIIPHQPQTAWTTGAYNHMPTMGGAVKDEGNFGLSITEYFSGPPQVALTAAQYTGQQQPLQCWLSIRSPTTAVIAEYGPG